MHLAFRDGPRLAQNLGCQALQVFCGNPRGWRKAPLEQEFVAHFREGVAAARIEPLVVHATYLINLAARAERLCRRSREGLVAEVARAAQLGARYYVIHCGSHGGAGVASGRQRAAASVREALARVPQGPDILLENSAGGGAQLGAAFEELAALLDACASSRVGMCLDTCHTFAAGYDIRTSQSAAETLDALARTVGLERLRCLHINDSKGALNSHLDRHQHIGRGQIGDAGFRAFFSDRRLWNLPAILETPKVRPRDDPRNLRRAIGLALEAGAVNAADVEPPPRAARMYRRHLAGCSAGVPPAR